jgi:ABC-type glycerol-3-phosphate transport system permease component
VGAAPQTAGLRERLVSWARSRKAREVAFEVAMHVVLLSIGVFMLVPFVWLVSTSLKAPGREFVYPPQWIPNPVMWSNYPKALTSQPFHLFLKNTLIVAVTATSGAVLTASMVAYGFARLRFPGRDFLFVVLLSTMMLPGVVVIIPKFILFRHANWIDTLYPLTVPWWFGGHPFYIFLYRQFFLTLPLELEESARIDGASSFRIWWQIILPLSTPVVTSVSLFCFMARWNEFLGPLIYINSVHRRTLALGLQVFKGIYSNEPNLMMAASTTMIVPILVIFFMAQRYFVQGIAMTGLTGR